MRHKPKPDTRPRWDDPSLPVFGKSGRPIDPAKMVLKAQMTLAQSREPTWRNDPTYNLKRGKK